MSISIQFARSHVSQPRHEDFESAISCFVMVEQFDLVDSIAWAVHGQTESEEPDDNAVAASAGSLAV